MDELLIVMIVAAVVLVLALCGLFVVGRAIVRGLLRQPLSGNPEAQVRCRHCDNWVYKSFSRCDFCGKDWRTPAESELEDLAALERQLKRFEADKTLEPPILAQLRQSLEERRQALRAKPAARTPVLESQVDRGTGATGGLPSSAEKPRVDKPPVAPSRCPNDLTFDEPIVLAESVEEVKPPSVAPIPAPLPPPRPVPARDLKPVLDRLVSPPAPPAAVKPQPVSPPKPVAPPPPPRQSLLETIATFLEERNIQWAELVVVLISGLLIVGASVALVINFWETVRTIPWLKFAIFVAYTAAIFGAGMLCYHRWKLDATGRGLLVIGTLLVPLNFLAMASVSREDWSPTTLGIELVSLIIFGAFVHLAGRAMVPKGRSLLSLAVVGNSAAVLLVARLGEAGAAGWSYSLVGLIPVAVFLAAVGIYLYRRSETDLPPDEANAIFILLGMAVFSLAGALGLLIYKRPLADGLAVTLNHISVLLVLAAFPIVAAGLAVMRGTTRDAELAVYRTAGTAVALLGMLLMLAAVAMAWPDPLAILLVGTIATAALAVVAFRYELPLAHAGAIATAALVYLTGYHVLAGNLSLFDSPAASKMLPLARDPQSGVALVGLVALLASAGELLRRFGRKDDAPYFFGGCGVIAVVSLLLVTGHALHGTAMGLPLAMVVYALYGVGSLAVNPVIRRPLLSYLGLGLLAGATLWALRWQTGDPEPLWALCLAGEALLMAVASATMHRLTVGRSHVPWDRALPDDQRQRTIELYRLPFAHAAEVIGVLALALGAWTAWTAWPHPVVLPAPAPAQAVFPSPALAVTALLLTALGMLTAWGYRSAVRTGIASTVVLAGLIHTLAYNYVGLVEQPWLISLLAHATLAGTATIVLQWWLQSGRSEHLADDIRRVFTEPLSQTAMVSSGLAVPVLAFSSWHETLWMAGCLWWLAAIWLVIAWMNRSFGMIALSQAAMTVATLTTTHAWLQQHPFGSATSVDLTDPRCLQTYGIGLALLTLAWVVVRLVCRKHPIAGPLLDPGVPSVDRVVGHGVVALQTILAAAGLFEACGDELARGLAPAPNFFGLVPLECCGPTAWLLVGLLAASLVAMLWYRWGETELVGSLLLVATVPMLIATPFDPQLAAASAARWAMGTAFVVVGATVWQRKRLHGWATGMRANLTTGPLAPRAARTTLVATTALPVIALTLLAALLKMAGAASGPTAGFFADLGTTTSYLVPLLLVIAGLVGFAVRESSAGYAFSAGLVVKMAVVLGYSLHVLLSGKPFTEADAVTVVQLATITAGVWAIAWLAARRWLNVWREQPATGSSTVLMRIQLALAVVGNTMLIGVAMLLVIFEPNHADVVTQNVGMPLGWLALALLVAATVYRRLQLGQAISPNLAGLVGMTVLCLLACTVQGLLPDAPIWGYRTLMLGMAVYSLFVVLATWWVASLRTLPGDQGPPQTLIRAASRWVATAGLLAVALGLKAAFVHEDQIWAAAAIAVASLAGATMAFWRRAEGWAFAAAPGVNLAASLVVWWFESTSGRSVNDTQWLILMAQANVIASMAVALVWLAARKRLYELRDLSIRTSPLLAIQTSLGILGNAALLLPPVANLLVHSQSLPTWGNWTAQPAGWIALVLTALATSWYLWQTAPERLGNVLAGMGLGLGVLLACLAGRWNGLEILKPWPEYHVLIGGWTIVGLLVLGVGVVARNLAMGGRARLQGNAFSDTSGQDLPCERELLLPPELVRAWVLAIGAAILGLAVPYCSTDPAGPWWAIASILCLSLATGILGMWQRHSFDVQVSGSLLNAAAIAYWLATREIGYAGLVTLNVSAFAVAAILWSLLEQVHRNGVPAVFFGEVPVPAAHAAAWSGQFFLAMYTCAMVVAELASLNHMPVDRFAWSSLAATALAAIVLLWDPRARFPLTGLYLAAFSGVALLLVRQDLPVRELIWTAPLALAGFSLVAAVVAWGMQRTRAVWEAVGISNRHGGWPTEWFPAVQAILTAVAAMVGVWISLDLAFEKAFNPALPWLMGRLAGPLALGLLIPAGMLTLRWVREEQRSGWQTGVLVFGLVLLCTAGWAWLSPEIPALWLHRSVILLVAAAAMTLVTGLALPRMLPENDWLATSRQATPGMAGMALAALAGVLGQEVMLFTSGTEETVAMPAIIVVAAALVGLIAGAITLAVVGRLDPLRLSDRGRTAYVYAAEVLLALVGVHLRLTMPWLFQQEIVEKYWMLIVLGVAFAGAALSEFFHRRGLPVLSEPLWRTATLLPIAPAIGFWFFPKSGIEYSLAGASPALWFLAAAFYGMLGGMRRSAGYLTLASLVLGVGTCVLWDRVGLHFLEHLQLWLIPCGLILLLAEHLNRDRLTDTQTTALRYIALSVIYISSSSEYLRHLGNSITLPIVLILLSLAGVLAGLVLRIRSFLYMGATFLVLVILTLIKYAAVDQRQTWIVWIFCIVLGTAMLGLFGLFKNHREGILAAVRRLRTWDR